MKIATIAGQSAALIAFIAAGMIFIGLTIHSPIGLPAAERQGIAVSTADVAAAHRLGSLWWLFGLGVVLSFGGAVATLGKLMQRMATPSRQ
jgi:hypothetical protein